MMLQDFAQVTKHNINEVKAELKETENDVLELGKKCRKTKRMDAIESGSAGSGSAVVVESERIEFDDGVLLFPTEGATPPEDTTILEDSASLEETRDGCRDGQSR